MCVDTQLSGYIYIDISQNGFIVQETPHVVTFLIQCVKCLYN
jgi:hypothetical protein